MSNKEIKELYTRRDVERILKISRSQIYNLLQSGRLSAYKVGGNLRFQRDDISKLIESHPYSQRRINRDKQKPEVLKRKIQSSAFKKSKGKKAKASGSGAAFQKALKFSEGLELQIDNQEKKYKIGSLLIVEFKDFQNQNPYIAASMLKRYFKEAIEKKFSLKTEEGDEILRCLDLKFKEFGRKIFIRSMQQQ